MEEEITQEKFDELCEQLEKLQQYEDKEANIFDAVGVERQEVKHSAFIAWLLDPNKPHGLGKPTLVLSA